MWSLRDSPADVWNERYERLRAYKEKFGHCRVPIKHDKDLNQWMLNMRHYYKNTMNEDGARDKKPGKLSAEKIVRLQMLGFEWEVREKVQGEAWEARFRDMLRFRAGRGHCRVPKQHPADQRLSHWVYEQRKNHKGLRTGSKRGRRGLTDERIQRLEEVGFEWSVLPHKAEVEAVAEDDRREEAAVAEDDRQEEAAAAGGYETGRYEHTWIR